MKKKIIVIGSGFSGLSAACFLAKQGFDTLVLEKHTTPGGRARQLQASGFSFDMGPSWYWMPDVFDRFFAAFGKKVSDYYTLSRLDPSYRIIWPDGFSDIPAGLPALKELFESWEAGASKKLDVFLKEAAFKYRTGMQKLVYKPGLSFTEFIDPDIISGLARLDIFMSMKKHVHKFFKHPRIRQLLEFPILFLGALPEKTPALYSLMNYADIVGGTWYPNGGMYSVVTGMYDLAGELGVRFHFNENVTAITVKNGRATEVVTESARYAADAVVGSADYHFIENELLPKGFQSYDEEYWNTRQLAPSCLLFYVGISKKLKNAAHHLLFFDTDFNAHGQEIYSSKTWPADPLFYVSVTSVTDAAAAPPGCENLFFLIPVAAGLTGDNDSLRERYFQQVLKRFEQHAGEPVNDFIVYKKSFAYTDFVQEYNSYKGNAYGLANTLGQTAILKPKCRSRNVKNLFYTGQSTVPGPGVPPSLISGEVIADVINTVFQKNRP